MKERKNSLTRKTPCDYAIRPQHHRVYNFSNHYYCCLKLEAGPSEKIFKIILFYGVYSTVIYTFSSYAALFVKDFNNLFEEKT